MCLDASFFISQSFAFSESQGIRVSSAPSHGSYVTSLLPLRRLFTGGSLRGVSADRAVAPLQWGEWGENGLKMTPSSTYSYFRERGF
jgi:hypothetical protein